MTITLETASKVTSAIVDLIDARERGGYMDAEMNALSEALYRLVDRERLPSGDAPACSTSNGTGDAPTPDELCTRDDAYWLVRASMPRPVGATVAEAIRSRHDAGESVASLARDFGVSTERILLAVGCDVGAAPQEPSLADAYDQLSYAARSLLWQIMNGDHTGAYVAKGTAAEAEAIEAKCAVADGGRLWVAQEIAHRVSRASRPTGDAPQEPGGAAPGLREAVKAVEAELRTHEGSQVPAGYAANLVRDALAASEGDASPEPTNLADVRATASPEGFRVTVGGVECDYPVSGATAPGWQPLDELGPKHRGEAVLVRRSGRKPPTSATLCKYIGWSGSEWLFLDPSIPTPWEVNSSVGWEWRPAPAHLIERCTPRDTGARARVEAVLDRWAPTSFAAGLLDEIREALGHEHQAETPTRPRQLSDADLATADAESAARHEGTPSTVPDAPGLWKRHGASVLVDRRDEGLMWWDPDAGMWRFVFDADAWGGRCTPGDAGVRARIEAALDNLTERASRIPTEYIGSPDHPMRHYGRGLRSAVDSIRAALEEPTNG